VLLIWHTGPVLSASITINGDLINDNDNADLNPNLGIIELAGFSPTNSPDVSVTALLNLVIGATSAEFTLTDGLITNLGEQAEEVTIEFSTAIPKLEASPVSPLQVVHHVSLAVGPADSVDFISGGASKLDFSSPPRGASVDSTGIIGAFSTFTDSTAFATQTFETGFILDDFSDIVFVAPGDIVVEDQNLSVSNLSGMLNIILDPNQGLLLPASASISVSAIPIPPSVWLFGTGLMGLVAIARRKKAA
jgi:hypothetical protein